jgi:ribosome maturation factor RimP
MKEVSKHFENEIGNQIEIKVAEETIEDVAGILVTITGPDSTIDMHVTRLEAEILFEQLNQVLTHS